MGLLGIFKPKPAVRYEDITGFKRRRPGRFRKWRLILFFSVHPEEFERYKSDWENWMVKSVTGGEFFDSCAVRGLRKTLGEQYKKARELRKEIRAAWKDVRLTKRRESELLSIARRGQAFDAASSKAGTPC